MVVIKIDSRKYYKKKSNANIFRKLLCCRKNLKNEFAPNDKNQSKFMKLLSYVKNNVFKELFNDIVHFFDTTSLHGLRHVVARGVHPIERYEIKIVYYTYQCEDWVLI